MFRSIGRIVTSRSIRTLQSDGPGHRSGRREIVEEKCSSKSCYRLATVGVVHVRARKRRMFGSFAHSFRWVRRNNNNIIIILCKILYYDSNVCIIIFIFLLIIGVLALFVDFENSMLWVWSIIVQWLLLMPNLDYKCSNTQVLKSEG